MPTINTKKCNAVSYERWLTLQNTSVVLLFFFFGNIQIPSSLHHFGYQLVSIWFLFEFAMYEMWFTSKQGYYRDVYRTVQKQKKNTHGKKKIFVIRKITEPLKTQPIMSLLFLSNSIELNVLVSTCWKVIWIRYYSNGNCKCRSYNDIN